MSAITHQWKDLSRYIGIKRMSAGKGRPGTVPVEGSKAYPQSRGQGAPDGTGDFESGSRGGPSR